MNVIKHKWKLNVSQCLDMGGRNHMEDFCYTHFERRNDSVIFGLFGIFDGHGGTGAAEFVQKTLKDELLKIDKFWSSDNSDILESIKLVYLKIQNLLWIDRENWPKTINGYKSTAGTTATIAIIRNGVLYTGHVGDSAIVLLYKDENDVLQSEELTKEHKPDNPDERKRIEDSGGSLRRKAGIDRVVWNRRKLYQKSKDVECIPFLAVARSLGDLWSYDSTTNKYHVSPEPDVTFVNLDSSSHRAIIIGSDGLWNVISRDMSVRLINLCEILNRKGNNYNPSQVLVKYCLYQWQKRHVKADNISAVVILLESESLNNVSRDPSLELDETLTNLYAELQENNLLKECNSPNSKAVLDNFLDLSEFQNINRKSQDGDEEELELLQTYIHSDHLLSSICKAWPNSDHHWRLLMEAFKNLDMKIFPTIVSFFETCGSIELQDLLIAFPWSVCCLDVLDVMSLSIKVRNFIKNQQLLTDFWSSFYRIIINQCFQFFDTQLTDETVMESMRSVIINKTSDLNGWVMSMTCSNPEFLISSDSQSLSSSNEVTKFSLKKSNTHNGYNTVNEFFSNQSVSNSDFAQDDIYKCFQLKKSASFDIGKTHLYCNFHTKPVSYNGSGSSTPILVTSDCDTSISPEETPIPEITSQLDSTKKHQSVPYSLKRKISENVTQIIFLPCKESRDTSERKIIKKLTLSRHRRFIL